MPTIPQYASLTTSTTKILNAIRNEATTDYKNYIPIATQDQGVIRTIGATLMSNPNLQNEFINALVNRIAKVVISSRSYRNPLAMFKKGMIDYGETIQDIFIELAKPFQYNPKESESTMYKREIPNVLATFYTMNYQKYYKRTIQRQSLNKAFLSSDGVTSLIEQIIETMYTSMNYDEFLVMKYMLARHILDGKAYAVTIPTVSQDNIKTVVATVKEISNKLEFMNTKYNLTGVHTHSTKENQIMISDTGFDALCGVEVLATAFNLDPVKFLGNRVLIDGFNIFDNERLSELFNGDPTYREITTEESQKLAMIPCIIVDKDFFQIYDHLLYTGEKENPEGLYWNYWVHTWKTFATSPYANNIVFVEGTPSITSVSVSPNVATVSKGQVLYLQAQVVTENFASKRVTWTVDGTDSVITADGNLTVGLNETEPTLTVTCTSIYDPLKTGTATITVNQ